MRANLPSIKSFLLDNALMVVRKIASNILHRKSKPIMNVAAATVRLQGSSLPPTFLLYAYLKNVEIVQWLCAGFNNTSQLFKVADQWQVKETNCIVRGHRSLFLIEVIKIFYLTPRFCFCFVFQKTGKYMATWIMIGWKTTSLKLVKTTTES